MERRLREEVAKLRVEINEEKSRLADLAKGDSFGFLGFDFRRILSRQGAWRPNYTPKLKKRTALLGRLGGKEDPAASDASPEAEGLRLAAVE